MAAVSLESSCLNIEVSWSELGLAELLAEELLEAWVIDQLKATYKVAKFTPVLLELSEACFLFNVGIFGTLTRCDSR